MTTFGELFWEVSFEKEHGRKPTDAERAEFNARMDRDIAEYQAQQTPEQRKLGEEGAQMISGFVTKFAQIVSAAKKATIEVQCAGCGCRTHVFKGEREVCGQCAKVMM